MTIEEKLDKMLMGFIQADASHTGTGVDIARDQKWKISDEEASLLALKLDKDGYITWTQITRTTTNSQGTTKEKLDSRTHFRKNIDGIMFAGRGGYVVQLRDLRNRRLVDRFQVYALSVGAILAGIYYLKELCVWLFGMFCHGA